MYKFGCFGILIEIYFICSRNLVKEHTLYQNIIFLVGKMLIVKINCVGVLFNELVCLFIFRLICDS